MINLHREFSLKIQSVYGFNQIPNKGYYIPLCKRPYCWDKENVEQLLNDISKGVVKMLTNEQNEIRFLGTIITVIESNKKNIEPQDPYGLPFSIENVIDGQQRLSTISMLAVELYFALIKLEKSMSKDSGFSSDILEICNKWKGRLIEIFSLDLKRGTPERKPKIIRGSKDAWTKDGDFSKHYKSSLSKYLALAIDNVERGEIKPPQLDKSVDERVYNNSRIIRRWISSVVLKAHDNKSDDYPSAKIILKKFPQEHLWDYDRDALVVDVVKAPHSDNYKLASLIQLVATCHYLLDRCFFVKIRSNSIDKLL